MKPALSGFTLEQFQDILAQQFLEKKFRAKQIMDWVYKGASFSEMRNIPNELRVKLEDNFTVRELEITQKKEENKTGTIKYLLKTKDDIIIECVVLSYEYGNTICVSSQAGCPMMCAFCASGKDGLIRNLSASEMMSQLICAVSDTHKPISNIVLMGSGEPLDNYEQVKQFISSANDPNVFGIGIRNITLSTCGIIPGIARMIEDRVFINLSVSMHAPFSDMRAAIMPVERKYPIQDVIKICERYRSESGRRITYEYSVVSGLNDTDACADEIYKLLKRSDAHVNLIGMNEGNGNFAKSDDAAVREFEKKLLTRNINCTIRRKLGSSINAACGQLKSQYVNQQQK